MFSLDLLVNLILVPIGFLLLVYIRERLHRIFLPRDTPRARTRGMNRRAETALPSKKN